MIRAFANEEHTVGGIVDADAAFVALFMDEYEKVFRTIYSIVGEREAARDVTQEAFARAYAHWKRVSAHERPGAWVRRVAIRVAVRSIRGRVLQQQAVGRLPPPPTETAADPDLHRALLSLPTIQRGGDRPALLRGPADRRRGRTAGVLGGCGQGAAAPRAQEARGTAGRGGRRCPLMNASALRVR